MKKFKIGMTLLLFLALLSCNNAHQEQGEIAADVLEEPAMNSKEVAGDEMKSAVSSSAARPGKQDSVRKFIRTAELRFKTKNVIKAVYNIEDVVGRHDGFIASGNIAGEMNYTEEIPVSKDSTLILTHYTVTSQMTIRVPNAKLDTTLKDISRWIDYLDYRTIKADDVSLNFLAGRLAQKRESRSAQRVENAIDNRGRRLNETVDAEETLSDKQQNADNAYLSNLLLMDSVTYSTITLSIYQRESIMKELTANEKNVDAYQSFGYRLLDALRSGGNALLEVFLFLVNIWPVILVVCVGIYIYKKVKRYRNKEEQ